jgi:hypothetical protein
MRELSEARIHLAKAKEFLDAAICITRTGHTKKSDNHADAVRELKLAGPEGAAVAPKLKRLLDVKSKAQYGARNVTPAEAGRAVGWAEDLYRTAKEVIAAAGR